MPKFRKKPVVIEAERFLPGQGRIPEGVVRMTRQVPTFDEFDKPFQRYWGIYTLEGIHEATEGDWIITGIAGEKYPCKPHIFEATYEPVEDECSTT